MKIKDYIFEQAAVIKKRDPAMHSPVETVLYASFWAVIFYRIAHKFYVKGNYFIARLISQFAAFLTGIEIHPGAKIGHGFFIDHGSGVVIGETTEIGDNVTLYQGVTLGGTGKEHGKRHPTLGNNVMVSAGARVLGSFKVGDNSKIGAGSVVLSEVPPNCTVVGVPGRVVRYKGTHLPCEELDHGDLPDPVEEDIMQLKKSNSQITNRLLELEDDMRRLRKSLGEW